MVDQAELGGAGGVTPQRQDVDLVPLDSLSAPDVELADLSSLAETETLLQEVGLL